MHWLVFTIIPPVVFAIANHFDKHLVEKYFKGGGVGSLAIFSALIGLPVFLLIWAFNPDVFGLEPASRLLLILNGAIYICGVIPYIYALEKDEASIVSPLFLLIPVIGYILGYIFLNETLTMIQLVGSLVIMFGALGLTLEITKGEKVKLKLSVLFLMLLSSALLALNRFMFKFIAVEEGVSFWTTAFWEYLGFFLFAVFLFVFIAPYRKQFLEVFRENKKKVLGINAANEVINIIGEISLHFATLIAPLAVVLWISEGFQPMFVLIFAIIITKFFPKWGEEKLEKRHLVQKVLAILVMFVGTYLLSM